MAENQQPWWATNRELQKVLRRSLEDFEREGAELEKARASKVTTNGSGGPDPVLAEVLSGGCRRELKAAHEDLARSRARYDDAVRAARAAGYSWGEISRIVGVSKQLLHRRFR